MGAAREHAAECGEAPDLGAPQQIICCSDAAALTSVSCPLQASGSGHKQTLVAAKKLRVAINGFGRIGARSPACKRRDSGSYFNTSVL